MSSSPSQQSPVEAEEEEVSPKESGARLKDSARDSRFRFRNVAEYQMRRELKEAALEQCDEPIKQFAECATDSGIMVVFSCQSTFQKINECMNLHNGEEAWQKYKAQHDTDIERRARGLPR